MEIPNYQQSFSSERFGCIGVFLYFCTQILSNMDVAFILDKYFKGTEILAGQPAGRLCFG